MSKLALIRLQTGEIISQHTEGYGRVTLPEQSVTVSPPVLGWEDEAGEYRLVEVVPAGDTPEGKRIASIAFLFEDGKVFETPTLEDIPPPPPEPSRAEKLEAMAASFGLSVDDLVEEFGSRLGGQ